MGTMEAKPQACSMLSACSRAGRHDRMGMPMVTDHEHSKREVKRKGASAFWSTPFSAARCVPGKRGVWCCIGQYWKAG